MSITVKHLQNPSDKQMTRAAYVLHEAFQRKYFQFALSDECLIEPFLLAHIKATVIGGRLYVAVLPEDDIVGVALWFGPGQKFLSSPEQREAGWNQTMQVLEVKQQEWWENFLNEVDVVTDKLYGPGQQLRCYHLQTFGVLPNHQRRGYGTALMTAVENQAVKESKDVLLETLGEGAVPVYRKMGFEVLGPVPMKTGKGMSNAYGFKKGFTSAVN